MRAALNDADLDVHVWVRLFLLFNLGPLPLAVLFGIGGVPDGWQGAIAATWGALIGLSAGILRASLLRCLAGVNIGAAAGMAWWNFVETQRANDLMACVALAFAGAVLGMALNARRASLQDSLLHGGTAGFIAFGIIGTSTYILLLWLQHVPGAFAWFIFGIPMMLGLGVFFWMIVDHGDPEIDGRPAPKKLKPVFDRRYARALRERRAG